MLDYWGQWVKNHVHWLTWIDSNWMIKIKYSRLWSSLMILLHKIFGTTWTRLPLKGPFWLICFRCNHHLFPLHMFFCKHDSVCRRLFWQWHLNGTITPAYIYTTGNYKACIVKWCIFDLIWSCSCRRVFFPKRWQIISRPKNVCTANCYVIWH